jgi:hypothetical protein
MKNVFTLAFLLFCLKLSAAAAYPADSVKYAKSIHHASAKPNGSKTKIVQKPIDTAKTASNSQQQFSGNILAAAVPDSSNKQAVVVLKKDSTLAVEMVDVPANTKPKDLTPKKDWVYTLPSVNYASKPGIEAEAPEPVDNNPAVTSLIQLDSLRQEAIAEQVRQENLRRLILKNEQIKLAEVLKINNLDSLKQQLKTTQSDTVKALLYTRIALKYMEYDTISDAKKQLRYQNSAISYTLLAIHEYSNYNDSVGLRNSYTDLSKVYYSQRKYTEAKWFILQSNTLSRARNDTPNVISSLLALATIKSDIKDYTLAMGDLNEAMRLSIDTHTPKTELEVLKSYALLYSNMQDYPKEEAVLKKRDSLLDSINKAEQAQLAQAAALKKKQDTLAKKKLYLASLKKPSKNASAQKVASL